MRTELIGRVSVLTLLAGSVMIWPGQPAVAAPAACSGAEVPEVGSLDSGSSPDLPVGLPRAGGTSVIDIHYSSGSAQRISDATISPPLPEGLGTSLTSIDVTHDGCSELIAGQPGYNGAPGAVAILTGSPTGVSLTSLRTIAAPTGDAGFGASVASDAVVDSPVDLWVGAPSTTVSGIANAGAVEQYRLTSDGGVTHVAQLTAASLGGQLHTNAQFGTVLSARSGGVVIGVPHDRVSGHADAGSIWVVGTNAQGAQTARQWTQDSPGVPGKAEAGDRFGASVAGSGTLIVGSPYEDIGKAVNTGMVTLIPPSGPITNISQNSPGVPGADESTDHFGASVAQGVWLTCQESAQFAVGSPGEDLGKAVGAGMVTILPQTDCKGIALTQGKGGLGGKSESGDHVGAALSILRGRDDFDEDVRDNLVIGAPGEDIGAAKDAGVVLVRRGGKVVSYTYSGGLHSGTGYGAVLTQPGAGAMFYS